jgi:hypothetical protein
MKTRRWKLTGRQVWYFYRVQSSMHPATSWPSNLQAQFHRLRLYHLSVYRGSMRHVHWGFISPSTRLQLIWEVRYAQQDKSGSLSTFMHTQYQHTATKITVSTLCLINVTEVPHILDLGTRLKCSTSCSKFPSSPGTQCKVGRVSPKAIQKPLLGIYLLSCQLSHHCTNFHILSQFYILKLSNYS